MVKNVLQTSNFDALPIEEAQSIALQQMDNILEEWIDSAESKGEKDNTAHSDCGNEDKISRKIKAEALKPFQTPEQVPKQIDIDQAIDSVHSTLVARNLEQAQSGTLWILYQPQLTGISRGRQPQDVRPV